MKEVDTREAADNLAVLLLTRDYNSRGTCWQEQDCSQFTDDIVSFCRDWLAQRKPTT